ncbi:hypothetical protein PENSPDRAFT_47659 [Peniophora sp. CONT]|nr:hypothetical protein PENSPDRAFT_47659 [Peniophora sp. CONT]
MTSRLGSESKPRVNITSSAGRILINPYGRRSSWPGLRVRWPYTRDYFRGLRATLHKIGFLSSEYTQPCHNGRAESTEMRSWTSRAKLGPPKAHYDPRSVFRTIWAKIGLDLDPFPHHGAQMGPGCSILFRTWGPRGCEVRYLSAPWVHSEWRRRARARARSEIEHPAALIWTRKRFESAIVPKSVGRRRGKCVYGP